MRTSRGTGKAFSHGAPELHDVPWSDPRETIRRGSRLVSSRVGLIRHIGHGRYHAQDPATFALGIAASDISRFADTLNTSKGGGGGDDLARALAATLGEAAERYCMFFYDKQDMILATARQLGPELAVEAENLRLYSQEQIAALGQNARVTYLTDDTPVRWVEGWSLTHHKKRYVPASLVYMNYQFAGGEEEPPIGRNASSGLAAGLTIEEAILTGIQEVVERDAFTICWLCSRPGKRVIVDDEPLQRLMTQRFHGNHPKVSIRVHNVTLDVAIPSFFVVMQRPTELGPTTICVGSASRLDPRQAIRKCLMEAGQGIPYFRFLLGQLGDWQPSDDFMNVSSFDHHCVFYLKRPDLIPDAFAFLDTHDGEQSLSSIQDFSTGRPMGDVQKCVDLLAMQGLEVIVVEITTPDILEIGMRVVRVIIPGVVPLHGVYKYPFLGAKRLAEFPPRLNGNDNGHGHRQVEDGGESANGSAAPMSRAFETFNNYPHPFP